MFTEDYISFEIAKLLKEKGFDEKTFTYYEDGMLCHGDWFEWNRSPLGHISAPTHQMAMKWLREVHNIAVVIVPSMFWGKYNVSIYKKGNDYPIGFDGDSLISSYEEACEAAIKYCLTNLI